MFFNKLINNFKKILTDKYFCFEGRAGRGEYWMWVLAICIIGAVISAMARVLPAAIGGIISYLWALAILLPSLGAAVRRLHDINKSGWFILLNFIPFIGQLALIYFLASEGTSGSNQFGPRPCCCCCAGNDQPAEDAKNIDTPSDNRQ